MSQKFLIFARTFAVSEIAHLMFLYGNILIAFGAQPIFSATRLVRSILTLLPLQRNTGVLAKPDSALTMQGRKNNTDVNMT